MGEIGGHRQESAVGHERAVGQVHGSNPSPVPEDTIIAHPEMRRVMLSEERARPSAQGIGDDPAGRSRQILFNLVDNACKYARAASDNRIHLSFDVDASAVQIHLRDHGSGIDPRDAKRLFRPFVKSAKDAANSAPGVGLGLALSRRLARSMGGDLTVDTDVRDGACFVLRLSTERPTR